MIQRMSIEQLRKELDLIDQSIRDKELQRKEVDKELYMKVYGFEVGDIVVYEGIEGVIGFVSEGTRVSPVLYKRNKNGEFSKKYTIVCICNWGNRRDDSFKVIGKQLSLIGVDYGN